MFKGFNLCQASKPTIGYCFTCSGKFGFYLQESLGLNSTLLKLRENGHGQTSVTRRTRYNTKQLTETTERG